MHMLAVTTTEVNQARKFIPAIVAVSQPAVCQRGQACFLRRPRPAHTCMHACIHMQPLLLPSYPSPVHMRKNDDVSTWASHAWPACDGLTCRPIMAVRHNDPTTRLRPAVSPGFIRTDQARNVRPGPVSLAPDLPSLPRVLSGLEGRVCGEERDGKAGIWGGPLVDLAVQPRCGRKPRPMWTSVVFFFVCSVCEVSWLSAASHVLYRYMYAAAFRRGSLYVVGVSCLSSLHI